MHTEHVDGFTIESGADSMLAQKPAANRTVRGARTRSASDCDHATAHRLRPRRTTGSTRFPRHRCSVFRPPTDGIDAYELLTETARARRESRTSTSRHAAAHGDESVADFFRRQFGADDRRADRRAAARRDSCRRRRATVDRVASRRSSYGWRRRPAACFARLSQPAPAATTTARSDRCAAAWASSSQALLERAAGWKHMAVEPGDETSPGPRDRLDRGRRRRTVSRPRP